MDSTPASFLPSRLLLGVAYYPEYRRGGVRPDPVARDLDLMVAAGISVIRVGESVWSTWEPRDGHLELDWLAPVLDAAADRGMRIVLGTPTYAVPPWLQAAYPEIAGERRTGERIPWGARQEVDYTHPAFRFHAERVIRAIMGRYAAHPAVIGHQVDNEPGLELFHNHGVFTRFVDTLRARYGDVATLNDEWGLTYWSHRIDDWSQLWRPDGNTFPQYDLAWRRFQAEQTEQFIAWQAAIVGEYRSEHQFVTTCLQYPRPGLDDERLARHLDVAAGNPYYGMQDHLDPARELPQPNYWTTTGVAGLFRQADRMYGTAQARFLVTETNAQAIGAAEWNQPPYPGQLRQAALAFVARGAAMIEYWQWTTLPYGAETYWGGVLPHSGLPGRVYREIAEIGEDFERIGGVLDGYEPDADVAILWSNPSRFALQFMPPFARDGAPDAESYEHIVAAFHRGVIDAGRQARILHLAHAHARGAAALAERFPVLVAAGLYITEDADIALLREYVACGGHLVLGVRTAYADGEARARAQVAPPGLHDLAGVRYEEFSNLDGDVDVAGGPGFEGATARLWIDGLLVDDAEVIAGYDHPRFGDFAAVTTRRHDAGRVTVVGCVPGPALASALIERATGPGASGALAASVPAPVTVASGVLPDGRRVWFVFNWGWETRELTLAGPVADAVSGDKHDAGAVLSLNRWSAHVLLSR